MQEPFGFRPTTMVRGTLRVTGPDSGVELNTTIIGTMIVTGIFTNPLNTNMITATGMVTMTESITRHAPWSDWPEVETTFQRMC